MKALTLTQPWATLVILGVKRWETRSWYPADADRDLIYIHAAKGWSKADREFADELHERGVLPVPTADLPLGAIIGEARIIGLVRTASALRQGYISELEEELGDYSAGRYAWELANPIAYPKPIPARGMLGLWGYEPTAVPA